MARANGSRRVTISPVSFHCPVLRSKYWSLFVIVTSDSTVVIGHRSFNLRSSISYVEFHLVGLLLMSIFAVIFIYCCLFFRVSVATILHQKWEIFLATVVNLSIGFIFNSIKMHNYSRWAEQGRLCQLQSFVNITISAPIFDAWSWLTVITLPSPHLSPISFNFSAILTPVYLSKNEIVSNTKFYNFQFGHM